MADLLAEGAAQLAAQLIEHASQWVNYQQGDEAVRVRAVIGRSLLRLSNDYGQVEMQWTDRDYLIRVEDLKDQHGQPITPQRGDFIIEGDAVYEVLAPGGEPEWRYADPHKQMYRIHTKQVSE